MLSNADYLTFRCRGGMVQLRHLRYLVATVDAGSVSAAARAVHVTQPALSRQLRQLEADLGLELFDRAAGRMTLNRTGQALLPSIRDLLVAARTVEDAAAMFAAGRLERLTIAAPTATLTDIVSRFVATMTPKDPVVDVVAGDGKAVDEMLLAGADLAIGTQRPGAPFTSIALPALPVWAYGTPEDGWRGRRSIELVELVRRTLVVLPASFTARQALDAAVTTHAVELGAVVEAVNGTMAQALAAAGRGTAVVSDDPRFGLEPVAIRAGGRSLRIQMYVAWSGRGPASRAVGSVAERLCAWVAGHYPPTD